MSWAPDPGWEERDRKNQELQDQQMAAGNPTKSDIFGPSKDFGSWLQAVGGMKQRYTSDYLRDTSQSGNADYQKWSGAAAAAGLQNAMPPVTPQGTGAVATAGAPPPPGMAPEAVATPPQPGQGLQAGGAPGATQPAVPPPPTQPAATPAPVTAPKPHRRMVTQQNSKPLQGLRTANGAGY